MEITGFKLTHLPQIQQLFYDTVREINAQDYSKKQIEVWSSQAWDTQRWQQRLDNSLTYVMEEGEKVLGFAKLEENGHIDLFYIHYQHQGQGIGFQLLKHLEVIAISKNIKQLSVEASLTARPFFERQGFTMIQLEEVERQDVLFCRFIMQKHLKA